MLRSLHPPVVWTPGGKKETSVSDQADQSEKLAGSTRGEAAWKEAKERVAERNVQARKAGKQRRESYERQRAGALRAAEGRRMAKLVGKRRTP
jgi:hypothetical protein